MLDADRPITKNEQDRLSRSLFAKYLARCMLDHQDPESLVIGLHGPWSSGKTSLINLTLEELRFAASNMLDEEKPVILSFSPWSYSGQNQLIYSFFRRLSFTLRSVDYLENADRIIHLLELYVSFFTQKPVPKALRLKRSRWSKLATRYSEEDYGWESGRDLTLVKAELNELLKKQKHKIIIIIDNISRVSDQEVKQIFQIVKSMGDYANTIYMLAYDNLDNIISKEYLEKIIQLPFSIPPITQQDLDNILCDRLIEVLKTVPEETWNNEYWADIYYTALKFFFKTCRDITRYVNTLHFSYPHVRDIVNPVDYFTLTAIEVFLPEIYIGIRDNKDLFTDLMENVYVLNKEQLQKDKKRCDEILARCDNTSQNLLLTLLMHLFPRLRRLYQPEVVFYHSESTARKYRRICNPDSFDTYFRLSMPSGSIPQAEFETLLSLSADEETLTHALTRLNQDNRIIKFLDLLDTQAINKVSLNHIQHVIAALLDNGDFFPEGEESPLKLNTAMRIHRIIHRLLQRVEKSEKRSLILHEVMAKATKSLYIIVHELTEQGREHREEEDTFLPLEFRDLLPEQLASLQKLAVERIQEWAKIGRLAEHPKLVPILYAWKTWGSEEQCQQFVTSMAESDRGLIALLTAALKEPIDEAISRNEKNPAWEKFLDNITDFIPVKNIEPHAKLLFEDQYFEKLREREQLALMIFLDLIKAETIKFIPRTAI